MSRPRFAVSIVLLSGLALLSGCCANDVCPCQGDQLEDAIRLRLEPKDSTGLAPVPGSFYRNRFDTIRLVRTRLRDPKDTTSAPEFIPDTVVTFRPRYRRSENIRSEEILIANTTPFPTIGTLKANAFTYEILLTGPSRRMVKVRQRYSLTNIDVQGRFVADGCCTCYENTKLSLVLTPGLAPAGSPTRPASSPIDLKKQPIIELTRD